MKSNYFQSKSSLSKKEPIAIIGMSCHFPGGANNPEELWTLLRSGTDAISGIPPDRWNIEAFYDSDPDAPGKMYVRNGGFLGDISKFDAQFFGISPREAIRMDPQQRLLAEVAWEACENAGLAVDRLAASQTGVFIGLMNKNEYAQLQLKGDGMSCLDDPYFGLGSSGSAISGRLSYLFDLHGPSLTLDTGCSSSLVSIHLACQSLQNAECDLALVGGVSAILLPENIINDCKMHMLSPDGRCKTFDASADGYVPGEGCGVVILKRFSEAVADGNKILALIHGTAVNQDGRSDGLTAPTRIAQEALVEKALEHAGIAPSQISYVEVHGSGTALGDRTEVSALLNVLSKGRSQEQPLIIGTVKTNIGHLTGAAGIAGLIKTVLALQHQEIPPHLHLQELNPHIPWQQSHVMIPNEVTQWQPKDGPRIAGINSFGWSGTNAHVILGEGPAVDMSGSSKPVQILTISAKTDTALKQVREDLISYLKQHPDAALADIAYTHQVGRSALEKRSILVAQDREDAIAALEANDPRRVLTAAYQGTHHPIVFLLPGLGDHYIGMAQQLYEMEPVFRACVDHCASILYAYLGLDIREEVLYPGSDAGPEKAQAFPAVLPFQREATSVNVLPRSERSVISGTEQKLYQTIFAQPALFIIDYALAQLWLSWGIRPHALIGYSLGEYVAACLAGVFSLDEALMLVSKRAQMIQSLPKGTMLAIALPEEEIRPLLGEALSLAAINGTSMSVVAGPTEAVMDLERSCLEKGIACSLLQTSHAFHSAMMQPIELSLIDLVKTLDLCPPRIPYLSNVTGTWITAEQARDPHYWARHLCQPVRFADGLRELCQQPETIFLEVGPGQMLSSLTQQHLAAIRTSGHIVLPSLRHTYDKRSDMECLFNTLGQIWLAGAKIEWSSFYAGEQRRILPLPTYPFERQHYWVETKEQSHSVSTPRSVEMKLPEISQWFYSPVWKRSRLLRSSELRDLAETSQSWLIFADACGLCKQLETYLRQQNQQVTLLKIGQAFKQIEEDVYTINPTARDDYITLLKHLQHSHKVPRHIVHLWNVSQQDEALPMLDSLETIQWTAFYSLLFLAQALANIRETSLIQLSVISSNVCDVVGGDGLCPEKAIAFGPCKVIPLEYPNITCRYIDIVLPSEGELQSGRLIRQLMSELGANTSLKEIVAYRGQHRWIQVIEPLSLEDTPVAETPLREKGVYLITGGLGGLGLALAEHLIKSVNARLILVSRSALPDREHWEQWLQAHKDDQKSVQIKKLQNLENMGAELMIVAADVANPTEVRKMVINARSRFGRIDGVFHAAGVPGTGLVQTKTVEMAASVLAPKVKGTLALDAALKEEKLDFIVFYSSINAITGGLGEVDYCAANAFLDAFAHYKTSRSTVPTISINWNLWRWDAWQGSLFATQPEAQARLERARKQYGITFSEGEIALNRILANAEAQILVLPQGFDKAIEYSMALSSTDFWEDVEETQPSKTSYARPDLRTSYIPPQSTEEQMIAAIWQEVLGIENIGIHDHFFELGGNSLIGMLVISRLKKAFGIQLSVADLFEGPTISSLLALIYPTNDHQKVLSEQSNVRGKLRRERLKNKSRV